MIVRHGGVPRFFIGNLLMAVLSLTASASAQQQSPSATQENPQSEQSQKPAQQPSVSPPPQSAKSEQAPAANTAQSPGQGTSPENDRLFGVLPNYLTVENEARVPPLTPGGKFRLVAKNAFDPVIFPFIGFIAAVSQAQNSEPAFGQGAAGYGKRYGAAFGDSTIGSFMTGAVFPSLFKQDPRYFQLVQGGFRRRAVYSVSRIFITRTDSGHAQFNSSEIVGNLVAAGISNAYHPAEDRTLTNTLSVWGTGTGWDTMANLAEEFWPDIHQWLKRKFLSRGESSSSAQP